MKRTDIERNLAGESGMIVSWLVKLALGFAITAVVLFDAGSIGVNFFTLDSTADDIAVAMSLDIQTGQNPTQADLEAAARVLTKEAGVRFVSVELTPERSVVVTIRRKAKTLVVGRIGPISDWARATAEGRAGVT